MLHLPVTELPRQAEMTAGWSPAQQRPGPASLLAFCRPKQTMPEINVFSFQQYSDCYK